MHCRVKKIILTDKPGGVEYDLPDHCSPSCSGVHSPGISPPPNNPPYMTGEKGNNITIVYIVKSTSTWILCMAANATLCTRRRQAWV